MEALVSVIVPIYKVEKYLPRCIESICNQSYSRLEIILINDGSPDKCGEICDEYASKDNRIKVIHKENGGLSDARNTGIKNATGEYIAFIDSDDFIVNTAFEYLVSEATKYNLDIIAANAIVFTTEDIQRQMKKADSSDILTGEQFLCRSIESNSYIPCVWLNLYSKNLIVSNELFFKEGILHEDEQWTPRVFLKANRVKFTDFKFYYYVVREDSITHGKDKSRNGIDTISICYELEKLFYKMDNKYHRKILNSYLLRMFMTGVARGKLYKKDLKKYVRKSFIFGKGNSIKDIMKTLIFLTSMKLYAYIFEKRLNHS